MITIIELCEIIFGLKLNAMEKRVQFLVLVLFSFTFAEPAIIVAQELSRDEIRNIQNNCSSIESCIDAMRLGTAINSSGVEDKLLAFGPDVIAPLMDVIAGDDLQLRSYAAQVLWRFEEIDEKYLPLLIEKDMEGNPKAHGYKGPGWLGHVIGRTGTPESIEYLLDRFSERPEGGIYNHVGPAILRNKRKILPHIQDRLETFPLDGKPVFFGSLIQFSTGGGEPYGWEIPNWVEPAIVKIAKNERYNQDVRGSAISFLDPTEHPIALQKVVTDFAELMETLPDQQDGLFRKGDSWERLLDGDFEYPVNDIGKLGEVGHDLGPYLVTLFNRNDMPNTRAAAALALGQINYKLAIPVLLKDRKAYHDDWLLAYNVAESLGRLEDDDSYDFLKKMEQSHWHPAVRNNASRALNYLRGNNFAREGIEGDGEPFPETDEDGNYLFSPYRYAGEVMLEIEFSYKNCGNWDYDLKERELSQSPIGRIKFPRRGIQSLKGRNVRSSRIPKFSEEISQSLSRGRVTSVFETSRGTLIGTAAGEFIGGLDFIDKNGKVSNIVPDNIQFSFLMKDELYVVTGLSHMFSSYGELWVVDLSSNTPKIVRRIRLPSEVGEIKATDKKAVIFETKDGDVAMSESGKLLDLRSSHVCRP